jgi:hypothetical protein
LCALAGCADGSTQTAERHTSNGPPSDSAAARPTIRWSHDRDAAQAAVVEVVSLEPDVVAALEAAELSSSDWSRFFAVHVAQDNPPDASPTPMLGRYSVSDGVLRFHPQFPLQPGLRYRAVFDPARAPDDVARLLTSERGGPNAGADPAALVAEFVAPKAAPAPAAAVSAVYPSASKLPENQLKFYIHFSAPMSRGGAYEHIHLIDAAGAEVDAPFLELGEELWDPRGTRFTLFFDPGRIKRGLKPREEVGPSIEAGKRYTLVIDADWPDAAGEPLKEPFRKTFDVGPPDERQPDMKAWRVAPPKAGSSDPLVLSFPEPLDRAMLERVVTVLDSAGKLVPGRIEIDAEETRWRFTPASPWQAGTYRIAAQTTLEDLAGNSIGRPFEVDVLHRVERDEIETATIEFRPLSD